MATPTNQGSVVTNPGGTGSSIVPTLFSHQANDEIEIWVTKTGNAAWTAPAGWTIRHQVNSPGSASTATQGTLLYRRVLSTDTLPLSSPTCNLGATVTRHAIARTIRGTDIEGVYTTPSWNATAIGSGTANPIRPASVTTPAPEMLVTHYYCQRLATNAPEASGYVQDQEIITSGTLVTNVSQKNVADQATVLSNQDASPTSGGRWAAVITCAPSIDYPYYRSGSQATATATSVTPALPTGTTASDQRGNKDLVIATAEAAGTAPTPNTPGDWVEIGGPWTGTTSGGATSVSKWRALYDGSLDRQFNRSGSGEISVCLTTYYNCHQTTPIGNSDADPRASSTTSTFDAVARSFTKVLVQATCVADSTPSFTSPSDWIEDMDGLGISCSHQIFDAAGSTASASFTLSTANPTLVGLVEVVGVSSQADASNLVIQNTSHAHSVDSLALTQVHSLAVQNASHAHSANNLSLTQVHGLAIQPASHNHTADNVILSVAVDLSIANSDHVHTANNLSLTQSHSLMVAEASHAHNAANLVLTQAHSVVVGNASHAHTADNVTLAQVHQIVTQNADHAHFVDSLTLTQVHNLAIQSASHAHAAENVVLGVEGSLGIADAGHSHAAENVSLTQAHSIVVSNGSHAHSAENLILTVSTDLVVQPATHGHTAANIAVGQVHSVTVQSSAHNHTAENIVLATEGTLGTENATHAHIADNLTVTQVHSLVVENATHGHSVESVVLTQNHGLTIQNAVHDHTVENLVLTGPNDLVIAGATHAHTASNITLGGVVPLVGVLSVNIINDGKLASMVSSGKTSAGL